MGNQRCKGTRDLLPEDMRRFRLIEDVFRNSCRAWGYREVRTPTLEYLHLFTATGTLTSDRLSKVYSFLDWDGWSGERVVLRPDGTIPLARLFIDNLADQGLARLFYVTNIFIFEETGTETREQWQCGAEFIGSAGSVADAEVILLATEIIRNLGFSDAKLSLSHAGIIKALLKQLNLSAEEEVKALDQILEGNWEVFTQAKGIEQSLSFLLPLIKLQGSSSSFVRNLRAFSSRIPAEVKANVEGFIAVTKLLDSFDCPYEINLSAIHGFEYYTGICFQFLTQDKKVGGGGRYDNLIPLMEGGNVPACGFALYMDPLMSLMPVEKGTKAERGVMIRQEGKTADAVKACFNLAQALRGAGYVAEMDFNGTKASPWRWVVTVKGNGAPNFVVFDQVKKKTTKATSYVEVLNLVGGIA